MLRKHIPDDTDSEKPWRRLYRETW